MTGKSGWPGIDGLLCVLVALLCMTSVTPPAWSQDGVLHGQDLVDVARALLGNKKPATQYLGRKFADTGKFRSANASGPHPTEIEFAEFATKGRIARIDEVHVMCVNPAADFSKTVLDASAHATPPLSISGVIDGGYSTDSEGMIVAFVRLKDCALTK
jgi:hypothetical protein